MGVRIGGTVQAWQLVILACLATRIAAFVSSSQQPVSLQSPQRSSSPAVRLNLIPIARFSDDFTFLSETDDYRCSIDKEGRFRGSNDETFDLCVVEEKDLADLSRFVIGAFGVDAIRLSTDMSYLEQLIMRPAVELVNGYSGIVAFAEVLSGLRSRIEKRVEAGLDIGPPTLEGLSRSEKIDVAANTSLVLAITRKAPGNDKQTDVIGSVELRLQPCDAKIPFSLPWLDRIERWLASLIGIDRNTARDLQPYLSNLCVDETFRGQRMGRGLVRCVENIASKSWGFSRMYLHVDVDNKAAMELYKSEDYRDVGLRWKPFWAGQAADIGYFVKNLEQPAV